ncbi:MAG TPA: HAD family phosphatase [Dongiaceae bacterium]|nr:HAD family phosphatase [Dongiaceae bacterium]
MRRDSNPVRAVLFDFNGVLLDDEPVHFSAYRSLLAPRGIRLTRAAYEERYLPLDDHSACARMLADAGWPAARRRRAIVARLVRAKRRRYRSLLRRRGAAVPAGAVRLVRRLAGRAPLAIVSGATRSEITGALRRAGIAARFQVVVSAESVRRAKPAPDGYRQALRRVAAGRPHGVVAIEDSPLGILAARRAGLPVIGVATTYPPARLRRAGAFAVVRSLARPERVLALIVRGARSRGAQKRS